MSLCFLVFDLLIIWSESTSTIQQTFLLDFWNHLSNEKNTWLFGGVQGILLPHLCGGLQSIFIDPHESTRDSHHFLLGLDFPRWGQVTELNLKSRADAEPRCLWQLTMDVFFFFKGSYIGRWSDSIHFVGNYITDVFGGSFFVVFQLTKFYMTGNWINSTKFDLIRIAYRFAA